MAISEKTPVQQNEQQATDRNSTNGQYNYFELDLTGLLYRFLEKAHWILLTAIAGAIIAGIIVYQFITPVYQATSKIYIVGSDTTISLTDLQIGSNLAADYREVFKNWHVHELVDERLNLNYNYSKLASMISVNNPSGTHVLYVNAKSSDPEEAKMLADTYAQVAREFIATKMDMREPNIFEEARLPSKPVSPQRTRDILIGFLIGALLALAVVTVKFISDDRILSSDDVTKVGGMTTLGMVPLQEDKSNGNTLANRIGHKGRKE